MGVYQRRSDGRWCVAVTLPGGKRRVQYASNKAQAKKLHDQTIRSLHNATLSAPSSLTLADWLERWQGAHPRRASTIRAYAVWLSPYLSRLGEVKLHKLTSGHIEWAVSEAQKAGTGTKTLQSGWSTLSSALDAAHRRRLIGENPAFYTERPAHVTKPHRSWSRIEAETFIATAQASSVYYAPLLLFLLGTGLRISEAVALTPADASTAITVNKGVVQVKGRHLAPDRPKTTAGTRTLAHTVLSRAALDLLPLNTGTGRLFVSKRGTTPYREAVQVCLNALCREAGVPRLTLHDLRRTHSSLMAGAGVDVAVLQRRMGHSRASVTLDVYTLPVHPDKQAADKFDALLH